MLFHQQSPWGVEAQLPGSQGWGTAPVPAAVERGGEKREEEEAGWLPFCLGHTHTLLISNDGKGNTH